MNRLGAWLFAVFLALPAQAEGLRLDRPDADHLPPQTPPPVDPIPLPQYPVRVRPRIVYSFKDKLIDWAAEDKVLSHLCRRGAFVQTQDRFFWARTSERSYGVAFLNGGSLIDMQKKAKPQLVYFFEDQDGDCHVYVSNIAKLMPYYRP